METEKTPQPASADLTRLALVRAALKLFAEKGFEGTSTREVATAAKANIGSIAYHFGGKEGLREAAAGYIAETIAGIAGTALAASSNPVPPKDPEEAQARILGAVDAMVGFMLMRPEADSIVKFMLREMTHPTAALDTIYASMIEPTHRRLCGLWALATGEEAESEATRIRVFSLIGQALYFRIGREVVMRRMGWPTFGPAEAGKILPVLKQNVAAIIRDRKS